MPTQNSFTFNSAPLELPKTLDGRGPEVVSHPLGGYTHAIPTPGSTCRVYEGQWMLKRNAVSAFYQRYPQLVAQPRVSKARRSSVPLPLPKTDEALLEVVA